MSFQPGSNCRFRNPLPSPPARAIRSEDPRGTVHRVRDQLDIASPTNDADAITGAQVVSTDAHRVTISIQIAPSDPREVENAQQRVHGRRTRLAIGDETGAGIPDLFVDIQSETRPLTDGGSHQDESILIHSPHPELRPGTGSDVSRALAGPDQGVPDSSAGSGIREASRTDSPEGTQHGAPISHGMPQVGRPIDPCVQAQPRIPGKTAPQIVFLRDDHRPGERRSALRFIQSCLKIESVLQDTQPGAACRDQRDPSFSSPACSSPFCG